MMVARISSREPLAGRAVAVSVSDSPDLPVLGLGERHLRDAMVEVARHLLIAGARLLYGGDLRPGGFTDLLLELIARHQPNAGSAETPPVVTNYLPWPVHMSLRPTAFAEWIHGIAPVAALVCLGPNGGTIAVKRRARIKPIEPTPRDWSRGLSSMRNVLTKLSAARVILGGRVEGFKGKMPGIAEEALASLRASKPVFVLGGFGGCARDLAETMGLVEARQVARITDWTGRNTFASFGADSLNNGLTADENTVLVRTAHIDEAVTLMLRGVHRLFDHAA